jgi:hypothetical protein
MAPDGAKSGRGCLGGRVYRACRGQAGATRFRHIAEIGWGVGDGGLAPTLRLLKSFTLRYFQPISIKHRNFIVLSKLL